MSTDALLAATDATVEAVLSRQWELYMDIAVFLLVSVTIIYGIWRVYARKPRRIFKEHF